MIVLLGVFMLVKDKFIFTSEERGRGLAVIESNITPREKLPELDSDGDGLKDWEEVLYETDPHNKDTYGKGLGDAGEVKKRQPALSAKLSLSSENKNLTTAVNRELLSQYFSMKQTESVNTANINILADRIVSELEAGYTENYLPKDLKVISGASKDAIRLYGNTLAGMRETYLAEYTKNPVSSPTGKGFGDPVFEDGMRRAAKIYKQMADDIMTLSVPNEIANIHLELANNYKASAASLEETVAKGDPMQSITSLGVYLTLQAMEINVLDSIATYFSQNGIIFSESESGFVWNNQ